LRPQSDTRARTDRTAASHGECSASEVLALRGGCSPLYVRECGTSDGRLHRGGIPPEETLASPGFALPATLGRRGARLNVGCALRTRCGSELGWSTRR